jgi:hypothetical protein
MVRRPLQDRHQLVRVCSSHPTPPPIVSPNWPRPIRKRGSRTDLET